MVSFNFYGTLALLCYSAAAGVIYQTPGPPATDPFYQPPSGFASTAPGTVLRSRSVDVAIFGDIPDPVEGYQLLYRTTAIDGSAIAGVTTIFKPTAAYDDRFVSFQSAEDSASSQCATSYNLLLGSNQTNQEIEILIIELYLASGYIVSAVDDEGPDSAFTAGHLEGMVVLDSMRAVSNFGPSIGLSKNPAIVGAGYSGGAIATGWAASLQHVYAPELDVKGWSFGGTPANLTGTLLFIDGTPASGFGPDALAGQLKPSAYGATLNPLIDGIITPFGQSKLSYVEANCAADDISNFESMSVLADSFQSLGANLVFNPIFVAALEQSTMGINSTERPIAPVLIYHGIEDEIVPYEYAPTLWENWCSQGSVVEFTTYGVGGHVVVDILGAVPALLFANDAFALNTSQHCSQTKVLTETVSVLGLNSPTLVLIAEKLANELPEAEATDGLL